MEKQSNSSNSWLENTSNSLLDEKILTYFKINWFSKTIPEMYKTCIWDNYTSSDAQKRRLLSYLIIKKDKLTIDLVLKNSGKNSDFATKSSIFKSYIEKWWITINTAWSLIYTWTMQQNLEMLHLLVQESFIQWLVPQKQVAKAETKQKLISLSNDIVNKPKDFEQKIELAYAENFSWESKSKLSDILTTIKLQDDWINNKFANISFESDWWKLNQSSSKFDIQNLKISSTKKDEEASIVENADINWSIDPKKVKLRPTLSRAEMFWHCSKMARLYLESLKIKRENILIWNSIDLIKILRKTKTWTEYTADVLTTELLARAKEWKWNMYDIYFLTPKWHRVIVFIWTDSELYVLDPYYAWNKPVKIMDYSLSKTWKGYRSVMVPNKDWYIIEEAQLLPKKKSSK